MGKSSAKVQALAHFAVFAPQVSSFLPTGGLENQGLPRLTSKGSVKPGERFKVNFGKTGLKPCREASVLLIIISVLESMIDPALAAYKTHRITSRGKDRET
ncbi:hypothetical protein EFB08_16620 [Rufibacter latericius]|uniref:Uncharacterized protein n=1 Tax=Rufibacter latericius TaxID=2487040 RepID=A0A3M9MHB7_9BACT|nr:hypothetical protein EFB08_16620 [Rufibacter latericius]